MYEDSTDEDERLDTDFSSKVIENLQPLGVYVMDITGDEMGKTHAKHLAGGRPGLFLWLADADATSSGTEASAL